MPTCMDAIVPGTCAGLCKANTMIWTMPTISPGLDVMPSGYLAPSIISAMGGFVPSFYTLRKVETTTWIPTPGSP